VVDVLRNLAKMTIVRRLTVINNKAKRVELMGVVAIVVLLQKLSRNQCPCVWLFKVLSVLINNHQYSFVFLSAIPFVMMNRVMFHKMKLAGSDLDAFCQQCKEIKPIYPEQFLFAACEVFFM
jgi:hypothetical protein